MTRRYGIIAGLAAGALMVSACQGDGGANPNDSLDTEPAQSVADLGVPEPDGAVTTKQPMMVLDDGDGAQLCLGGVMESYPPQCGGPTLIGWDWESVEGDYEQHDDVRWGEFVVSGHYDLQADEFEVDEVTPASEADPVETPEVDFTTTCPEPEGGWEPEDLELTTHEALTETQERAHELDTFAGIWVDNSLNPAQVEDLNDEDIDDEERKELEASVNDPEYTILNVLVTEDPESAEQTLRETWGGMLCVTEAEHTGEELERIQEDLMEIDGVLSVGQDAPANALMMTVAYDDGSLQDQLDEIYGSDVVEVVSLLSLVE